MLWGVIALALLPGAGTDRIIGKAAERYGGKNDAGDRLMVQLGLDLYDNYGDALTIGTILEGIRDTVPQMLAAATNHGYNAVNR